MTRTGYYGQGRHILAKVNGSVEKALVMVGLPTDRESSVVGVGAAGLKKLELALSLATGPPLLQSPAAVEQYTAATWSPTRPGVASKSCLALLASHTLQFQTDAFAIHLRSKPAPAAVAGCCHVALISILLQQLLLLALAAGHHVPSLPPLLVVLCATIVTRSHGRSRLRLAFRPTSHFGHRA